MTDFVSHERVEAVARQLCSTNGYDPDKEWVLIPSIWSAIRLGDMSAFPLTFSTPMPAWRAFEPGARKVLQAAHEIDAP